MPLERYKNVDSIPLERYKSKYLDLIFQEKKDYCLLFDDDEAEEENFRRNVFGM
ncbi:MAG: hypothetical protein KAI55_02070 [Candidatus Aenigmarchaeota archaeon]|nr:hypothetical protein [Candidatus Aenigmarchaeota archaeon]